MEGAHVHQCVLDDVKACMVELDAKQPVNAYTFPDLRDTLADLVAIRTDAKFCALMIRKPNSQGGTSKIHIYMKCYFDPCHRRLAYIMNQNGIQEIEDVPCSHHMNLL